MSFSRNRNPNPQLYQIRADVLLQTIARPVWLMSCSSELLKNTTNNNVLLPSTSPSTDTVTGGSSFSSVQSTSTTNGTINTVNNTTTGSLTLSPYSLEVSSSPPVDTPSTVSTNLPSPPLSPPSSNATTAGISTGPTFYHIPDTYLVSLRNDGFDYLYILGVWQTGDIGLNHSQTIFPHASINTLVSSPFAVADYHVDETYGGDNALRNLKQRANNIGLRILIDFIPNHIARDHWWVKSFPWLLQQYYYPFPCDENCNNNSNNNNTNHSIPSSEYTFPLKVSSRLQQNYVSKGYVSTATPTTASGTGIDTSPLTTVPSSVTVNSTIGDSKHSFVTLYLYYGRDMYNIWKDTVNLNHRHPDTRTALLNTLRWILTGIQPLTDSPILSLASFRPSSNPTTTNNTGSLADGVRVDMAMLLLNEVIGKTWGTIDPTTVLPGPFSRDVYSLPSSIPSTVNSLSTTTVTNISSSSVNDPLLHPVVNEEFWTWALADVKSYNPSSLILGEVYWDYEAKLQTFGFDFTYDKSLLDKLYVAAGDSIMQHLRSSILYQRKCAHFIENHDEKRIAAVHRGGTKGSQAAAVIAYTIQGLHFFHDGQMSGRKLHHSVHARYRAPESTDMETLGFYKRLLTILKFPEFRNYGCWHQAIVTPSRDGNDTWRTIVAYFITPLPGSTILQTSESVRILGKNTDENSIHDPRSTLSTVHSPSISSTVNSPVTVISTASRTNLTSPVDNDPTVVSDKGIKESNHNSGSTNSLPSTTNSIQSNHSNTTDSTTDSRKMVPDFMPLLPISHESSSSLSGSVQTKKNDNICNPVPSTSSVIGSSSSSSSSSIRMGTSLDPEDIIAGRTFLVVVNYSERSANGHVLFTRADESTYQQHHTELINSATYISSLVNGQLGLQSPTGCSLGIFANNGSVMGKNTSSTHGLSFLPPSTTTTGTNTSGSRRLGFIDHLSSFTKEYPCSVLANEGWWVSLEPWKAHILELVQLSEE